MIILSRRFLKIPRNIAQANVTPTNNFPNFPTPILWRGSSFRLPRIPTDYMASPNLRFMPVGYTAVCSTVSKLYAQMLERAVTPLRQVDSGEDPRFARHARISAENT